MERAARDGWAVPTWDDESAAEKCRANEGAQRVGHHASAGTHEVPKCHRLVVSPPNGISNRVLKTSRSPSVTSAARRALHSDANASIPVGPPQGRRAVAAAPRSVVPHRQAHVDGSNAEREGETSRSAAGGPPVIRRARVAVDRSVGTARRAPLP